MNISDMMIDKVVYKEFTRSNDRGGTYFSQRTYSNVPERDETVVLVDCVPCLGGELTFNLSAYAGPSSNYRCSYAVHVDNTLVKQGTLTISGVSESTDIDIEFNALSSIRMTAICTGQTIGEIRAYISGYIVEKFEKYIIFNEEE